MAAAGVPGGRRAIALLGHDGGGRGRTGRQRGPLLAGLPNGERAQLGVLYWRGSVQRYVPVASYLEWIAETTAMPDHLAVTLENHTPGACTVNLGDLFPVLLLAGETRAFETPVGEILTATCSDGTRPPPSAALIPPAGHRSSAGHERRDRHADDHRGRGLHAERQGVCQRDDRHGRQRGGLPACTGWHDLDGGQDGPVAARASYQARLK